MKKLKLLVITTYILFSISVFAQTKELKIASWNVESGGADTNTISSQIEDLDGYDLWGLSEVDSNDATSFENAAEVGENENFDAVLGSTGGRDRLLIIYSSDRFRLLESFELHNINPGGRVRAPLVARFFDRYTHQTFYFMVNHLYRSSSSKRHQQAKLLNEWASSQEYPIVTVGDFNFDWDVDNGDYDHDQGYDLLTADYVFQWVRPYDLVKTQASNNYNSVLDFVFVSQYALGWQGESEILVTPGDFPDDYTTSDHRPVLASFQLPNVQ